MVAKWRLIGLLTVLVSLLAMSTGQAGFITKSVVLTNVGETPWTAVLTYDDRDDVALDWSPGITTANGVLGVGASLVSNQPIRLVFTENAKATENADRFGIGALRFSLTERFVNNSSVDWSGFTATLKDLDGDADLMNPMGGVPNSRSGLHPSSAHFHPGVAANYDPFTLLNREPNGVNMNTSLVFGGATVAKGGGRFDIISLSTHDIQYDGFRRRFELTEAPVPVPEPSSLILFLTGIIGLVGCGRCRLRRHRD